MTPIIVFVISSINYSLDFLFEILFGLQNKRQFCLTTVKQAREVYYISILENKEVSFLRLIFFMIGPFKYFDFGSDFFLIMINSLLVNLCILPPTDTYQQRSLTIRPRHISPFTLYLYLKPLYSIRGGSTTLAEPLIKKPLLETLRKNPL